LLDKLFLGIGFQLAFCLTQHYNIMEVIATCFMFSVPEDICLLGCIFYIADYQKYLENTTLDMWRQVVNII